MHEPLADPVTVAKLARKLFPDKTDLAEAALLAIAWLAKIKANGDSKSRTAKTRIYGYRLKCHD